MTATMSPSCTCGGCRKCHNRAAVKRYRATPKGRASCRRSDTSAAHAAARQSYVARNSEKVKARQKVGNEIRTGRLRKGPCEYAGADCDSDVHAHHDDYSKPLDVRWLCARHHYAVHREAMS